MKLSAFALSLGIAFAAHADPQGMILQQLWVIAAGVLHAKVGMMNQYLRKATFLQGHL